MKTRYKIFLDSQLGIREGELCLSEDHNKIKGVFSLLGFDNPVSGECAGPVYHLHHGLHTLVRELSCNSTIEIRDNQLSGIVTTENTKMKLWGQLTPFEEGKREVKKRHA